MPDEEENSSTTVRLLQLGDYTGDGEQKAITKQDLFGLPLYIAMHCAQMIFLGAMMFFIIWIYNAREGTLAEEFVKPLVFFTFFTGGLVVGRAIFDLVIHIWYLKARLFFGASIGEAWYWQGNGKLRRQCVQPKDADEFKLVIQTASRLDHERARAFVAEEVWELYSELMFERDLMKECLPEKWFKHQIAPDADFSTGGAQEG